MKIVKKEIQMVKTWKANRTMKMMGRIWIQKVGRKHLKKRKRNSSKR